MMIVLSSSSSVLKGSSGRRSSPSHFLSFSLSQEGTTRHLFSSGIPKFGIYSGRRIRSSSSRITEIISFRKGQQGGIFFLMTHNRGIRGEEEAAAADPASWYPSIQSWTQMILHPRCRQDHQDPVAADLIKRHGGEKMMAFFFHQRRMLMFMN